MDDFAALLDRVATSAVGDVAVPAVEHLVDTARRRSLARSTASVTVVLVAAVLMVLAFAGVGLASEVDHQVASPAVAAAGSR